MFWEKRKEKAEVCGEDQDIVYENVAVPEIHIGKKRV